MDESKNKVEELLRRVKMTTSSRYGASERLNFHNKATQWTIAFISVALIFIPMAQAIGMDFGIKTQTLNFFQSVLAIMVLVYSLLLGQENFKSRSEAMHRNAVELGRFARKLRLYLDKHSNEEYSELVEEYYTILEKYENHSRVDYCKTALKQKPKGALGWLSYTKLWLKTQLLDGREGFLYIPAWTFIVFVIYTLINAPRV
ncbi:SLATT domain-containing protein [Vibrio harveyi]|uniref:SLATT domain-containing protein n=1 Tax=Vibrio harveyi TaxID=669 RepID=UPI003BB5D1F6